MEFAAAIELGRNAFWMAVSTSAPILVMGLVVGLAISLFQAVTPTAGANPDVRPEDRGHDRRRDDLHSVDCESDGRVYAGDVQLAALVTTGVVRE